MEQSIRHYMSERRGRVSTFCEKYYGWRGMRTIHAEALKEDLLTNPLNLLWAIPHALLRSAAEWSRKLGWAAPSEAMKHVPAKFKTGSQKRIEWLLHTELLELPLDNGTWQSRADALAATFLRDPQLAALQGQPEWDSLLHTTPGLWKKELQADSTERSAAADLASGFATLAIGWLFFGRAAMGVFGMGEQYAKQSVREEAVRNFSLGPIHFGPKVDQKIGNIYYTIFPANPTQAQIWVGTAIILVGVALLSVALHALLDPLQQSLGLHEVRLRRFLDALEARLLENVRTTMSARVLAAARRDRDKSSAQETPAST